MSSYMTRREIVQAVRAGDYAWPGGYPVVLVCSSGDVCRPSSLRADLKSHLQNARDMPRSHGFTCTGVLWEGDAETDCITGEEIETAYGPVAEDA